MEVKDFSKKYITNDSKNIIPPINAQEGLNILIKHFLGEDWYTIMPMNTE